MTRQEMIDVINAGGSVSFANAIITTVADVPTQLEIDAWVAANTPASAGSALPDGGADGEVLMLVDGVATWHSLARGATDFALGVTPTSNVSYSNIAHLTDGDDLTSGAATAANMPQQLDFDLGSTKVLTGARALFTDSSHLSLNGKLRASTDGVIYQDVVSWTNDTTLERILSFTPTAARYWRWQSTAAGVGGNGINVYTISLLG